jgi:hypothetical protein
MIEVSSEGDKVDLQIKYATLWVAPKAHKFTTELPYIT